MGIFKRRKENTSRVNENPISDKRRAGEEIAAIVMALQLYSDDMNIEERDVITINRVNRIYSPWSSKIYGLRPMPARIHRK